MTFNDIGYIKTSQSLGQDLIEEKRESNGDQVLGGFPIKISHSATARDEKSTSGFKTLRE